MRVLMVILNNHIGGISVRAIEIAKRLHKYDIETQFVVPNEKGDLAERLQYHNLKTEKILLERPSPRRMWSNIKWLMTFPISILILTHIILRDKVDIVHVNGLANLQAPIAALLTRRKIVWHLANTMYPPLIVSILMPVIVRIAYVITISKEVEAFYYQSGKYQNEQYPNRQIVHEPVDTEWFSPSCVSEKTRSEVRKELSIKKDTILIGVIGNIVPVKGHEFLLKALPPITMKYPNACAVFVGSVFETQKDYFESLNRLAVDLDIYNQVRFLGLRQDVRELLASFDLFVLPSIFEGTPIAILEAMSMEKAIIATYVGGIPDVIDEDISGVLVEPKSPSMLATAIIELIENEPKRVFMGKNGRKKVKRFFSIERCAEAHRHIYENLAANAST